MAALAIVAGQFGALWIYLIAPPLGAGIAAAGFALLLPKRPMLTPMLCGDRRFRELSSRAR
jgi:hypothetical protein